MLKTRSIKQNIAILVSLMREWGIKHVVVCPGSRNAPIVHSLANVDDFECHPVTDERSAAFVALGMADATKQPVAVCCTSGSALLNISPAVAEAYYRHVPLLVISADRPAEWIGQMDGQTLVQPGSFGPHAKTYSLPEPKDETQLWYVSRIVNEALAALNFDGAQPVHINVHLSEPLFDFTDEDYPKIRKIEWERGVSLSDGAIEEIASSKRVMVIVGQIVNKPYTGYHDSLNTQLNELASKGCLVLAEHLSNVVGKQVVTRFDDVIASGHVTNDMCPDMVIYVGGHVVSKRLKKYLRQASPSTVWHLTDEDSVIDLFQCVSRMVRIDAMRVLGQINAHVCASDYAQKWITAERSIGDYDCTVWSDASVVGNVLKTMPTGSSLVLSNSSSVRHAQHFKLPVGVEVICNRGVNGIEGSLSAAVGYAMASQRLTLCVIGDLSFLYDMNALWNVALPPNLRIIVLNNSGGLIFGGLPGLEASNHRWDYVAACHNQSVRGWVESVGANYVRIDNMDELVAECSEYLWSKSESPIVFEVFSDKCGEK